MQQIKQYKLQNPNNKSKIYTNQILQKNQKLKNKKQKNNRLKL